MLSAARPIRAGTGLGIAVLTAALATGCGSGDSTVAKIPAATPTNPSAVASVAAAPTVEAPASTNAPPADPCAVNLTAPAIANAVSELPRDPRSQQPWSTEPLAGNYNECAQLSAVIVKANTTATNPNTRAVLFHLGQVIARGVPDTYGFTGVDIDQSSDDVVALQAATGIAGLASVVRFRWTGDGVEVIPNTTGYVRERR